VQANFKETVLRHVKPGMKARITFPMYPGQEFTGTVETLGWNVNRQQSARNGLPVVEKENEWFLLPQRFPVQIALDQPPPDYPLHVGQSANVQIQTGHWQCPSLR
jgi:multidrug resistance efflux pump